MSGHRDPYGLLAPIYVTLEAIYGGGAIGAAKRAGCDLLVGRRVLYVGAGTAAEAPSAARAGARVSLLEPSPAMGRLALARFTRAGLSRPHLYRCRLDAARGRFEVVVANFFLNIFTEPGLRVALTQISDLLEDSGLLLIADFAPLRDRAWLQRLHWYLPLVVARLFTRDPIHPVYDYVPMAQQMGFRLLEARTFRPFRFGPAWYRFLVFSRDQPSSRANRHSA